MRLDSMRTRMTLVFSGALLIVMLLACSGMIAYAYHTATRSADAQLRTLAERIAHEWNEGDEGSDLQELIAEQRERGQNGDLAVLIVDAGGRVLQHSPGRLPPWPVQPDSGWRVLTRSVGANTAVVALPWNRTMDALRQQATLLALLCLVVVVVASFGAWLLVGRTLAPLGALSRQAQAASVDSLRLHLSAPSRDVELVELVSTLNGLLERLAETAAARGRFYAAASHELRTPLQALSGHLEVALSRERTNPENRAALQEAHRQTRRLTALVRDLLLLNQLDAATNPPPQPIDLTDICARTLAQLQPLRQGCGLDVQSDFPNDIEILAPPTHAEMLVRNLIENAIKYADAGGTVRVQLRAVPEGTVLEIFNTIPTGLWLDTERLFEPFYRPDESRSSETGGNGLGLAICKAIAAANGWKLTLQQDASGVLARVLF